MRPRRRSCREEIGHSRLAVNTALAHVFRSGEILGLYTKYLGGVGLGVSNWAGVVFMFGGLPE